MTISTYLTSLAVFKAAAQASAAPAWSAEQLEYIEQVSTPAYAAVAADFLALGQRMQRAQCVMQPDAVPRDAAKYLRQQVLPLLDALASVGEAARERHFDLQAAANDYDGGDHAA